MVALTCYQDVSGDGVVDTSITVPDIVFAQLDKPSATFTLGGYSSIWTLRARRTSGPLSYFSTAVQLAWATDAGLARGCAIRRPTSRTGPFAFASSLFPCGLSTRWTSVVLFAFSRM
jgi:hypothetical protein